MSKAIQSVYREIEEALAAHRFETARRRCLQALAAEQGDPHDLRILLHDALRRLGDLVGARQALASVTPRDDGEALQLDLLRAEDYVLLAGDGFYRTSKEKDEGLCVDEYKEKYEGLAEAHYARARELADSPARRELVAASLRRAGRRRQADELAPAVEPPPPVTPAAGEGRLEGRLVDERGRPVADATVTLGFPQAVDFARPESFLGNDIGSSMAPTFHGEQETRSTRTDTEGRFRFDALPAQTYEFLAVTLDGLQTDIAVRFVARDIAIRDGATTTLEATVTEWRSAPAVAVPELLPATPNVQGQPLRRVFAQTLRNPFHFPFPRQLVCLPLPAGADAGRLCLVTSAEPDRLQPVQPAAAGVACFLELPPLSDLQVGLYEAASPLPAPPPLSLEADGSSAILDTGRAAFRLPVGEGTDPLAPILSVRGEDAVWRGEGRLRLPAGVAVARRRTVPVEAGPLLLTVRIDYRLTTGEELVFELTAHRGEAYLLVREISAPVAGVAFEFSLREFSGGRSFLHWTPENGNLHWQTLAAADRELARLQESVAWWIPPQGFACAMTADSLADRDYIGVFTRRRGEWIDREFERLAQGPGDDHRELDWPYPEMVGSTISMITAHTTPGGDAFFRFAAFDGERQWGLLVSTLDRNDGPHKELSAVQHKTSSPRLQEFKNWRLDEPDRVERPFVLTRRPALCQLRRKKETPAFAPIWEKLVRGHRRGPARGLRAMIENDPALLWRLRREMLIEAPLRAKMTLYGRDYADIYSPVGGRGITPFAEQYDLIAATGVFSAGEERLLRATLMLLGHLFMQEDFMNWRYNSRNANFEADRVDIVGAVGLAFHGNPDADAFVRHAADLMERSLNVYCTPGSGKWYENPACYYLHAASCRLNLAFHLDDHGILDPTAIPRLRDFLSWGPLLLTAPYPADNDLLRDGCTAAEYAAAVKVRRVPPIGDHAHLGQWVSEFFALMGKAYRRRDPAFADFLTWAYQAGGSDGGHFSSFPLYFCKVGEEDLRPVPAPPMPSRRLEGFGAVFRGHVGEPNEFYLLFKQGPGGYRYHRTEGSFLLMAEGRPLVFDGGEAGETWRHSTLSFHDTHLPLAPGHVERFESFPAADFVQGVHPKALAPGEPVFLSDSCEHQLVEVAWQRFREPNPADLRSVLWIRDEYVVVHDDLRLPPNTLTHWHLQAVSDRHTGDPAAGWHFAGRYGVDLQVALPDLPAGAAETVRQQPILEYRQAPEQTFSMRHLQLTMTSPRRLTALLRPLAPGRAAVAATALAEGLRVRGEGIDDLIFLGREPMTAAVGEVRFAGRYGAVLRRPESLTLLLLAGGRLAAGQVAIEAPQAAVELTVTPAETRLRAHGAGQVTVRLGGRESVWKLMDGTLVATLPGQWQAAGGGVATG